ncbi:MAG TPA: hypothetical protein VM118_00035 [Acidobacteriota bacterium]|nr:hypothetical protein [Acidobacteriota bacterium]
MMKANCWELTKCGRQPGGANVHELGVCPAALDEAYDGVNQGTNGGRICWAIAGTLCGGKVQGTFAEKRGTCMACDIYALIRGVEGQDFIMLKAAACKEEPF